MRRRAVIAAPALALSPHPSAAEERADLAAVFREAGVAGCFVLRDAASGALVTVDAARAARRLVPASTFKIANGLIALETGVVRDVDAVIPYGGRPQPVAAWQRDMSIRDAVPVSNVPVFQEIARRVGLARYRDWLARLDYGNRETGGDVETFWLRGPLAISAMEQVQFVTRLAQGRLDAAAASQAAMREVLRMEGGGDAGLFGKTGWTGASVAEPVGWWVGWVARGAALHAFALNIASADMADAPKRLAIGRALLARLGVWPVQG